METTVFLCSIPELDIDYQNVMDFETLTQQRNFFISKVKREVASNYKADGEQTTLTLRTSLKSIEAFDYLFLRDETNKFFYYFITAKHQKTSETCMIEIELDVFSTYLFDFKLNESFVERCHVPRWSGGIPTTQTIDEGIPISDYVLYHTDTICKKENSYIFTSSTPLGILTGGGSSGSGSPSGGGSASNGIISRDGFRFIKGYEGFSPYACYYTGESFRTAGYGITENYQPTYFDRLIPFPCTEETASIVYCDMVCDTFGKGVVKLLNEGFAPINWNNFPQNKFDALVSFAMNCGLGNLQSSGIIEQIQQGASDDVVCAIIKQYVNAGGVEVSGLVARRQAECDIYKYNKYTMRKIVKYDANGKVNGYVTDNNGDGHYPARLGQSDTNATLQQKVVESAKKLLGKPYVYGGNYPPLGTDNGTDCSGLCQWAFYDNGLRIGRTTKSQINEGIEISTGILQPSDLIFTDFNDTGRTSPSHVVLYSHKDGDGNLWAVEASQPGQPIAMRNLGPMVLPAWRVRRMFT